jgi:hypothetical protein
MENKSIEKMNERARLLDKLEKDVKTSVYTTAANNINPRYVTTACYSLGPFGGLANKHLNCEPIDDAKFP